MKVSDQGLAFLAAHEGFVSRGYRDPAGVVTIGYGFTMRSRVFSGWWRARHGGTLAVGDRLSRRDANRLLLKMLDEEYAPPVAQALTGLAQHQFDACVSVAFNLGARALGWRWARALAREQIQSAASLLRATGTTAAGRYLKGLARRRAAEARLLETGDYGLGPQVRQLPREETRQLQRALQSLGFPPGPIDGLFGKRTRAAVRAFQRMHPPLVRDGVPGPATRAALQRAMKARRGTGLAGLLSLLVGGGASAFDSGFWTALALALAALALCCGGVLLWQFRGALVTWLRRFAPLRR